MICLEADRHWPQVLAALDGQISPTIAATPMRPLGCERRRPDRAELDALFATRPLSDWAQRFDEHDVWWAPVQSIVDVIADPQAQPGFVEMVPRDDGEPFRAVATPVDFDGHALHVGPVPNLANTPPRSSTNSAISLTRPGCPDPVAMQRNRRIPSFARTRRARGRASDE